MSKICTSLEQSQKLIELGIDVNTADMYWAANIVIAEPYITKTEYEKLIPAYKGSVPVWSLSALFKMLPYSARLERGHCTELSRITLLNELKSSKWHIDPIDAAFEIVCWLLENKML